MMSSRIFESSAAGAVIICNENPFARRHFADSLLYIDTTLPARETYDQVRSHLAWIKAEPAKALELARRAQSIFRDNFRLDTCLERMYAGLDARKAQLAQHYAPSRPEEKICVVFLMPEFHGEILEQHIASFQAQKYVNMRGVLAMDAKDAELFGTRVQCRLSQLPVQLEIAAVRFTDRRPDGSVRSRRPLGEAIFELLRTQAEEDYVCVVAPGERLFSDHMSSLLRVLQDFPEAGCSWSDMLQPSNSKDEVQNDLCDDPDVNSAEDQPIGCGRFLFRTSAIDARLDTALPHLDTLAMHLLFGTSKSVPTRRCTILSTGLDGAEKSDEVVPLQLEREILIDLSPQAFEKKKLERVPEQPPPQPQAFSLAGMTPQERTQLAVELAHSVPVPSSLKKLAFGAYRLWFRIFGSRASTRT